MAHAAPQPHRPATVIALAANLLDHAKLQIAAELVEQVNGPFPDCLAARMLSLRLELANDRAAEALAGAIDLLRIDPLDPAVLAIELRARRQLNEIGVGIDTTVRRLAAVAPQHPELGNATIAPTWAAIGFMHLRQGRHLLAQRWLDQALDTEKWPELELAIAQLQLEGGQLRAALKSSEEVLELLPNCVPANLIFAQANAEFGKLALAEQHLQRTRRFDPEFDQARRLYSRLPVSRLELPPAPRLDPPEMLLARAQRALQPPSDPSLDPVGEPASEPEPVGDYRPPSTRFLPAQNDSGKSASESGSIGPEPDPVTQAATADLARLMSENDWPAALKLLESVANMLDSGWLARLPSAGLPRLADELVRLNRGELAAEAYRLTQSQTAPAAPGATDPDAQSDN